MFLEAKFRIAASIVIYCFFSDLYYIMEDTNFVNEGDFKENSMRKKAAIIFILIFMCFFSLYAETVYTPSWLTLGDELEGQWNWQEVGEDLEGRLYQSSEIENAQYKILILCSKKSSSYILAFNKLVEVIENKLTSVEFYFFNFNKNLERASDIVEYGIDQNIDMIIAMGSEAMAYSSSNLLETGIPIVTCINKDPVLLGYVDDYKSGSGTNIAYTSVNVPLNINIEWLLKLRPSLSSIVLLYDPDHSSVVGSEVLPFIAYLEENNISYFDGAVSSGPELQTSLAVTIKRGLNFLIDKDPGLNNSIFWVTSSTNIFSEMEIISTNTGIVPVVTSVPNIVNESEFSAMMAFGIDRRNSANLAALYAVDILSGNSLPGDLPVGIVTPPDISISFQTAKRIGEIIPFEIFENASFVYGYNGRILREYGKTVEETK